MAQPILLKEVKKRGNSLIISFDKSEKKLLKLRPTIFIQIQILSVVKEHDDTKRTPTE